MIIPKNFESVGWCSRLKPEEKDALWKWMQSWTIIKDAGEDALFEIDDSAPDYLTGYFQLFLSERYIKYETTTNDLKSQMSVFLEGYRAASQK